MVANTKDPTILDDHPALQRKLAAFIDDYGLFDRPVLVWQAGPISPQTIEVQAPRIGEALREGVPSTDGWVGGFKSHERPSLIFEGLASFRDPQVTKWITEFHSDGHVIAGLWNFPEKPREVRSGPCLFPWHDQLFHHFGGLVQRLYAAAAFDGPSTLTVTLVNAKDVALSLDADRVPMQLRSITRRILQWTVQGAASRAEIDGAASRLAEQYRRLFGLANT